MTAEEARAILGESALGMTNEDIQEIVMTLQLLARESLQQVRTDLLRQRVAERFAKSIVKLYS